MLTQPEDGETLFLYLTVSNAAASGVLILDDRRDQKPFFYVRKSPKRAETRDMMMARLALDVVTVVLSSYPL